MTDQHDQGLYEKFTVSRNDGRDQPGGDREHARYFVLDPVYDAASRVALLAYADAVAGAYPWLARDLFAWCVALAGDEGQK